MKRKIRKVLLSICISVLTLISCGFCLVACDLTGKLEIKFKNPPYEYARGDIADAYDFIEKEKGVEYSFGFSYITLSEGGETISTPTANIKGNMIYLKEVSRYTLYVTAKKGEKQITDSTKFDVVGETPVLLPPSLSLVYSVGASARVSVLIDRVAPTVIPASSDIVVDYYTYQETQAPTLESEGNTNTKVKTELDTTDPAVKVSFDEIGLYEFHMVAYNGDRTADATFKVKVLPDQTTEIEGISAYKNAEFAQNSDGTIDSSIVRLVGSPDLAKASYAVLEDEFKAGQVARFEFYGKNMPSYIGIFNQDDPNAADPNSIMDGGKGYVFTMERLGVTDTARVYGYLRMNTKTSALRASNDSYPFENFGFKNLEDGKHYFFEIALKNTGKTEEGIGASWGGIADLEGKTVQHLGLYYSLYEVNDNDVENPYTLVAHSQVRFESSVGGCWFEEGEEVKGKLVAYSSISKDVTFKYYKDSLLDAEFDESAIDYDEDTKTLRWDKVEGAVNYIVTTKNESTDRFAILDDDTTEVNIGELYEDLGYFNALNIKVYASIGNNTFSDKFYEYNFVKYPAGMEGVSVSGSVLDYNETNKTVNVSLLGGFYDNSRSNTETHGGIVEYVEFGNVYTLDEKGTYIDVYFTGNNMPIVEFFADGTNEYFMSSKAEGKGFIVDNGLAASTANYDGSLSKYNGWSEYDGYFSYGVTSYYNRKRDAQSYTVGAYMENDSSVVKHKADITTYSYGEGTATSKTYVDMSMYSLAQVQKDDQNYRYTVGMYKDSDGYVWLDSTLYKIDENGEETLFSKWLTKAIMEGSAHSVTRDKLNTDETVSGKIVLRGAVKGRTSDNRGTETNVFTFAMPYAGEEKAPPPKAPMAFENATFNADGTVSLKSSWLPSSGTGLYDAIKNATLGYLALEGEYGLGTYVDCYFTGNTMPQVSFFNKYVTNTLSKTYNGEETNTGIVTVNGFSYAGGGYYSNEGYRFRVYGPNRIYDGLNTTALSAAYTDGNKSGSESKLSMAALSTMPNQHFKYTIGYYADESNNVYIDIDVDKVNENGVKTDDYYSLNQKLTGVTTADIQGNRIIVYGAINGSNDYVSPVTFSYSEPYTK